MDVKKLLQEQVRNRVVLSNRSTNGVSDTLTKLARERKLNVVRMKISKSTAHLPQKQILAVHDL
ncbi:hypothetical protein Sjap_019267 [Stephania japonica]|uniref:Uncharacterized protein n=1 Tax=Stephania japonica TaxID=461633 RepID=A0AAP0HUK1_9MAGN